MNLSFIKLDINILNDSKTKIIRKMPDGDKIMILWIGILCLAMKSGKTGTLEIGDGIPFTSEILAGEFDIPIATVKLGLSTFQKLRMIDVFEDGMIFISNFEKHQELSKIKMAKEKVRARVQKHRDKAKGITDQSVTVTEPLCNDEITQQNKTKIKNKTKTENKRESTPPAPSKDRYFDNVFLSKDDVKKLMEYMGKEELTRIAEDLSLYMSSKGRSFKSHYSTIRSWYRKDQKDSKTNNHKKLSPSEFSAKAAAELERKRNNGK